MLQLNPVGFGSEKPDSIFPENTYPMRGRRGIVTL